jgi:hypothetical protein
MDFKNDLIADKTEAVMKKIREHIKESDVKTVETARNAV